MSLYTSFAPPQLCLQERMLNEVCMDHVLGSCRGKCGSSHQLFRIHETESPSPRLTQISPNVISSLSEKRVISDEPFDNDPGPHSRFGPRHDNDHSHIDQIKILPTVDEILCLRKPYLPLNQKSVWNFLEYGVRRYLDRHFRYLRYDSVEPVIDAFHDAIRVAIRDPPGLIDYKHETARGTRYNLFLGVQFEAVTFIEKYGASFQLSYDCPRSLRGARMANSGILEEGMLCGIVAVHSETKEINVALFEVYLRQSTETMKCKIGNHDRAAVRTVLADSSDVQKTRECAYYAQALYNDVKLYLVDLPNVLPVSFRLHLEKLQELYPDGNFAFKDRLAPSDPYAPVIPRIPVVTEGFSYNLNGLKRDHLDTDDFRLTPRAIDCGEEKADAGCNKEAVKELQTRTTLDEGQGEAMFQGLNRDLALVQGPPGTGKSFLGVKMAQVILDSRSLDDKRPIIVVCMTNHAVDDFLEGIVQSGNDKVVRLGSRSAAPWINAFTIKEKRSKISQSCSHTYMSAVAKSQERTLFTEGLEMAEALVACTPEIKWASVKDYLAKMHSDIYDHFLAIEKLNPGISDLRRVRRSGFAFAYWLEGGDLNDFEGLQHRFSLMLGSCDLDDVDYDTIERIKKYAIESIACNVERLSTAGGHWLWKLPLEERKSLASKWAISVDPWEFCEAFAEIHRRYHQAVKNQRQVFQDIDYDVIRKLETDIVALTSTGFARYWQLISKLKPRHLIFEEASQLVEAHSVVCLVPSITHCIKIGDPKQLRPSIEQVILSKEHSSLYRHDESLFERLMDGECMPFSKLKTQRRAHPEMADLLRAGDYPFLKDHPSTLDRPAVSGLAKRMFWLDHGTPEDSVDPRSPFSKSSSNAFEARFVAALVTYLVIVQGYKFGEITVLTPYKGQIAALVKELSGICEVCLTEPDRNALIDAGLMPDEEISDGTKVEVALSSMLRITSVDNYQGEQAKVIIFSAVRSNAQGNAGFLKNHNRINVAISRAEDGLYVIGNSRLVSRINHWKKVVDVFQHKGLIGPSLQACCPRHAKHTFTVSRAEDFDLAPSCIEKCGSLLRCGHICQETCHPLQMHEDRRVVCRENCLKTHPCGHPCIRLCGQPCGKCDAILDPVVLDCGHSVPQRCGLLAKKYRCPEPISIIKLLCGHERIVICSEQNTDVTCLCKCDQELPCGHSCKANCVDCSTSGDHPACTSICGKELPCGHTCTSDCHDGICPECKQICRNRCSHRVCSHPCGKDCIPCTRLVSVPTCQHHPEHVDPIVCCLPYDILPCSEPCTKLLSCSVHLCPGLCGEQCKEPCDECDGRGFSKFSTINLDCNHSLSVREADRIVKLGDIFDMTKEGQVLRVKATAVLCSQHLICPNCSTRSTRVRRYNLLQSYNDISFTIDRLYNKLGKFMSNKMESMRVAERAIGNGMPEFLRLIKNGPLAGKFNQEKILERGSVVRDIQNSVIKFRDEVAGPVENSIVRVAKFMNNPALYPVPASSFKLRLELIFFRGRMVMCTFVYEVVCHLGQVSNPDKHTMGLKSGLLQHTVEECVKSIDALDSRIEDCKASSLPRLECEFRVVQVALWTVLRALGAEDVSKLEPKDCLSACSELIRCWPDTAGFLCGPYWAASRAYIQGRVPSRLPELYKTDCKGRPDLWERWSQYRTGQLGSCTNGHPFPVDSFHVGCTECGREILDPDHSKRKVFVPKSVALEGTYRDYIDEDAAKAYYGPAHLLKKG